MDYKRIENATIVTLMFDFLKYLIPQLRKLPRDQRFVLGDRIETCALDILDDFISAYYAREKQAFLQAANLRLEKLRFLIRLCHQLNYLSHEKYGVIARKINEIGGTLGNWLKFTRQGSGPAQRK